MNQKPMFSVRLADIEEVEKFELVDANKTNKQYVHFYLKVCHRKAEGFYEESVVIKNEGKQENYTILATNQVDKADKWCFLLDYFKGSQE